jgi:WD40 repeat protein/transcriptional regulator with XRE-family HTH domain
MRAWQSDDRTSEPFQGLLLLHRGRIGLTQVQLAARLGVTRRTVLDWEAGVNYPSAVRLQRLIAVLFESGGLSAGRESEEARALWAAVERGSPRMHTPFDPAWLAGLLGERAGSAARPEGAGAGRGAVRAGRAAAGGAAERRQDWGEAPDVLGFVGRAVELAVLRRWILGDRGRLVALLGIGGVGKTSLAAKLAQEVASGFERVYWRSLRDAPPVGEWLAGAIGFLSDQALAPPAGESERLAALLGLLRDRRCLLVLDNFETVFEPGQREGRYRAGLADYGRLLGAVGGAAHPSCLLLTSREAPVELTVLGGDAVHTFRLGGLSVDEARALLADKRLTGDDDAWADLVARYAGNALALRLVGESIRQLVGGEIGTFLDEAGTGGVFGGIRQLLAEQVERSSAPEQQVLRALAVEREPLRLTALVAALGTGAGRGAALEAVEGLRRRSLVERAEAAGVAAFTLQSVVLEYVTDRLVEDAADEIERGRPTLLVEQPLIQAQAREYVRQSQERLIGEPILQLLKARHREGETERRLLALLESWRDRPTAEQGYGPGNVINLLRLPRGDLKGADLSGLAIRQAYLQDVEAQGARLAGAHLSEAVLGEALSYPTCAVLSADGAYLVAGTSTGDVCRWRVADRQLLAILRGHTCWVRGVAQDRDGRLVVSCSFDGTVRLWEATTGRPLAILQDHSGWVRSAALSADGRLLVSGGADGTVRLWEAASGRPLATLQGHTGEVRGVALSGDGRLVASGSNDGTVRLWEAASGRPLATLRGDTSGVRTAALSGDGRLVASGGFDGIVRLWEVASGQVLATLQAHTGAVYSVALSGDGRLAASGGFDGMVRLWDVASGRVLATLQAHTSNVLAVALNADGRLVASGGGVDGTVRLWEAASGRALATLQGHAGGVLAAALSGDGRLVASGGVDGTVRLWDVASARPLATLHGHIGAVWQVGFGADGRLVASGGVDGTVWLWEAASARPLATLHGHTGAVYAVALSEDGQTVASGGVDGTVRIWDASSGAIQRTLRAERRYQALDITGLTGVTEAQRQVLLALGAVERPG